MEGHRAREAEAKRAKVAAETYTSIEEYWAANLAHLTDEQRLGLEERQDYVLELEEVMQAYIDGTDGTTSQELSDFIGEVLADVRDHGLCNLSVLSMPRLWSEQAAEFRKTVGTTATRTLISLGFLTSIPERTFENFRQKLLMPRTTTNSVDQRVQVFCSKCNSLETSRYVSVKEHVGSFVCHRCLDAEHRSCATANEAIYDARGQMKPKFWRKEAI